MKPISPEASPQFVLASTDTTISDACVTQLIVDATLHHVTITIDAPDRILGSLSVTNQTNMNLTPRSFGLTVRELVDGEYVVLASTAQFGTLNV